jgi:flavin-dependent dehydrogenase
LLDASPGTPFRYGETFPPEINSLLKQCGLWDAFQTIPLVESPGLVSRWGDAAAGETDFIHNIHGAGWHVDRARFDAMLRGEAASSGAHVMGDSKVTACRYVDGEWRIFAGNGGRRQLGAPFLVDACGAQGLRRGGMHRPRHDDRMLAVVIDVAPSSPARDLRAFIESAPGGWWYSAPHPSGTFCCMFFTDPETRRLDGILLREQLEDCPLTCERLLAGPAVEHFVTGVRCCLEESIVFRGGVAVGDSAAAYDPVSGAGVLKAIRHGVLAGEAIDAMLAGEKTLLTHYERQVREEYEAYFERRRKYYAAERRWLRHRFWANRRACGSSRSAVVV